MPPGALPTPGWELTGGPLGEGCGCGRGIGPEDGLKKDSRDLSWVAAGNPGFHRLVPVTY